MLKDLNKKIVEIQNDNNASDILKEIEKLNKVEKTIKDNYNKKINNQKTISDNSKINKLKFDKISNFDSKIKELDKINNYNTKLNKMNDLEKEIEKLKLINQNKINEIKRKKIMKLII